MYQCVQIHNMLFVFTTKELKSIAHILSLVLLPQRNKDTEENVRHELRFTYSRRKSGAAEV